MTQYEKRLAKYIEVKSFIETNNRNPSMHRIEEHLMLNFIKYNRKLMNKGEMKPERIERFSELLATIEEYKRKDKYQ